MPLFFLLSGFCLTLTYANKDGNIPTNHLDTTCLPDQTHRSRWNRIRTLSRNFYLNRISRILPVYYICLLLSLPLIPFGHGNHSPEEWKHHVFGTLEAFLCLNTLIMVHGFGPNTPAWTVCTLAIFYLLFPM